MAKEILYRIEFEGAQEQVNNLVKIREELDQIKVEAIKAGQSDKARAEELKLISQEKQKQYRAEQQAIKDSQKEYKAQAGTLEQLRLQAKKLGKELESAWAVGTPEFKKAASALEEVNRKIRNADKSAGNFKSNIGNYAGSIGDAFQGVGLNVGKLTGTIGNLGAATAAGGPLGIGLAALVGGAQLLGTSLSATDNIADKFAITMEKAKAATQVFFKALAEGDFSNFLTNIREAIKDGERYAKTVDYLEDAQRGASVTEASYRLEIAKLKIEMRDRSKSDEERKKAITEIIELETKIGDERVRLSRINVENELKNKSVLNQINKDQLKDLIQNFAAYEKQFYFVEKLQDAENRLRIERAKSGGGASGFEVADTGEVARLTKLVNSLTKSTAGYSEAVIAFGRVAGPERQKIAEALIQLYQDEAYATEATTRAQVMFGSLMAEAFGTATKAIDTETKAADDLKTALDNLIPSYGKLLKLAESMGEKKPIKLPPLPGQTEEGNVPDAINTASVVAGIGNKGGSLSDKYKNIDEQFSAGLISQEQYNEQRLQLDAEYNQIVLDTAFTSASQFVDIWQTAFTQQTDARIAALDMQYKSGLISEKQYQKAIAKERTEAAKKEKAAAIIKTIIGTAQSIIQTGATMGYPLAIPFQILAGIIGAAQIALIASQPVPQYAKGGMIDVGGNSHASGGTKFVGSDGSRFEAERGEVITVVNKRDSARLRALSDLNSEHGRPFYSTPSGNYFASGGMFQPNQNIGATDTGRMVRQIVSEVSAIPVTVSLNEIKQKDKLSRKADVIGAL